MNLSLDTTEKVVSLIVGLGSILMFLFFGRRYGADKKKVSKTETKNTQNVTLNIGQATTAKLPEPEMRTMSVPELKRHARVLFIDDDRGFKIVGVLKKMGWEHTKIISDVTSLEQTALTEATVVFVDIQGVGRSMRYADEGLGLVLAIKRRYPEKKVVIYSAQEEGGWFHEALQVADYSLPKTAEPIRFEETIMKVCSS